MFAILGVLYLVVARQTVGYTLGEALLDVRYHPPRRPQLRLGETHKGDRVSRVPGAARLELGRLTFDGEWRRVTGKEGTVSLTKREWQLLSFFSRQSKSAVRS
jgi:DNA-binding response OmpR family regulator